MQGEATSGGVEGAGGGPEDLAKIVDEANYVKQ
jgi:hypothetical protein